MDEKYIKLTQEWHNRGYEAGAQSRQAEVNAEREQAQEFWIDFQNMKDERDDLQKRIDEAMDELEYPKASWDEVIYNVIKTLKGNKND